MRRRSRVLVACAGVVVAMLASACGSGTGSAGANDPAAGLTGPGIKAVAIYDGLSLRADYEKVMKATQDAVNAAGGINGGPLTIELCLTNGDANAAQRCARDGVADPAVRAFVADKTSFGGPIDDVLQAAGMVSIAPSPYTPADTTSPASFPVVAGSYSNTAGIVYAVQQLHAKTIGYLTPDIPAARGAPPVIQKIIGPLGATISPVYVPTSAPDVSAQVATALAQKPDVLFLALDQNTAGKVITALDAQGNTLPLMLPGEVFDQKLIGSLLGSATVPIYVSSWTAQTGPGWDKFRAAMDAYYPDASSTSSAVNQWLAAQLLVHAATGDSSREAVKAKLTSLQGFDTGGLTPDLGFTTAQTALGGAIPRLTNTTAVVLKYADGALAPVGSGFVNPFASVG